MKIGELARQAGTKPETIRYYEREGTAAKKLGAATAITAFIPARTRAD